MSVKFYSNTLGSLDRIFRFDTQTRSLDRLETEAPIQPVLDVSRLAQVADAPGYFSFVNFSLVNTHAVVAGEVASSWATTPAEAFWVTLGVTPRTHWLWLIDVSLRMGPNLALTAAMFWINQTGYPFGLTDHTVLTHYWDTRVPYTMNVNVPAIRGAASGAAAAQINLPRIIPDNASLNLRSNAGSAVEDIVGQVLVAVTPKGVGPHGLF